jgi:hypothetical protein
MILLLGSLSRWLNSIHTLTRYLRPVEYFSPIYTFVTKRFKIVREESNCCPLGYDTLCPIYLFICGSFNDAIYISYTRESQ